MELFHVLTQVPGEVTWLLIWSYGPQEIECFYKYLPWSFYDSVVTVYVFVITADGWCSHDLFRHDFLWFGYRRMLLPIMPWPGQCGYHGLLTSRTHLTMVSPERTIKMTIHGLKRVGQTAVLGCEAFVSAWKRCPLAESWLSWTALVTCRCSPLWDRLMRRRVSTAEVNPLVTR